MHENYEIITDNYSLYKEEKISSSGTIPYNFSCLKDSSFKPSISENVLEKLQRYTNFSLPGTKPPHVFQKVTTTFDNDKILGYNIHYPLSMSIFDNKQWNRFCDILNVPHLYDYFNEMCKLTYVEDTQKNLIVAGINAIKYDSHGDLLEFSIQNACFDLNILNNNNNFHNLKQYWSKIPEVQQEITVSPYNENVKMHVLYAYSLHSLNINITDQTAYKIKYSDVDISTEKKYILDKLKEYDMITEQNIEYINSVSNSNHKITLEFLFDSDDAIVDIILKNTVVEKFKRV